MPSRFISFDPSMLQARPPRRPPLGIVRVATGILLGCVVSTAAVAQGQQGTQDQQDTQDQQGQGAGFVIGGDQGGGMTITLGAAGGGGLSISRVSGVQVGPGPIVVDPKTHTATVQFVNDGDDTAHANITVQDKSAERADFNAQVDALQRSIERGHGATGAAPQKSATKATGTDTAAKRWSLASWIQDLPKQVTLAPHEKRTVTLHLTVPSKLAAGTYSTYLTTTSSLALGKDGQSQQKDSQPQRQRSGQTLTLSGTTGDSSNNVIQFSMGGGNSTVTAGGTTTQLIVGGPGGQASGTFSSSAQLLYHAP